MSNHTSRIISTLLLFAINNIILLFLSKYGVKALFIGVIIMIPINIGLLISIIKLFPYDSTNLSEFIQNTFTDTITLITGMIVITIITTIISYKIGNKLLATLILGLNLFLFILSMGIVSKMNF